MPAVQIPQFIDESDKIIGPLTLKQFSFLAAAFLISLGFFYLAETWLWLIFTVTLAFVSIGLAFGKYNGRDMPNVLFSAFLYYWHPQRYIWQHSIPEPSSLITDSIISIKDLPKLEPVKKPSETIKSFPQFKIKPPSASAPAAKSRKPAPPPPLPKPAKVTITTKKPDFGQTILTTGASLKAIGYKLMTTKNLIPKREKSLPGFKERYAVLRKSTGERITAKRIDY